MENEIKIFIEKAKLALTSAKEDPENVQLSIKECSKHLRKLSDIFRGVKETSKRNLVGNAIYLLQTYRTQLKVIHITKNERLKSPSSVKWEDGDSAFQKRIRTGVIINLLHKEPMQFLKDCTNLFFRRVNNVFKNEEALKVNAVFCGEFTINKADKKITELKYMNTKSSPIYKNTDLKAWFLEHIQNPILKDLEEFQEKDSGWALSAIINIVININKFTQQLGSSYIELPKSIQSKHACVNVKNYDEACFAWAVISALYPVDKNPQRLIKYPNYSNILNLTGIQFPMTINQISRFEKQNNISINVYILKNKGDITEEDFVTVPTYLTKDKKEQHVNLLIIQNIYHHNENFLEDWNTLNIEEEEERVKYHYVWIKNLSRLLSSQLSQHHGRKFFCERCLHYFYTTSALEKHSEDCINLNECKIRLPSKGESKLEFKNYKNKIETPFVVYADLECMLQQVSNSNKYQNHVPCSIGLYVKCSYDPTLSFYKNYFGEDCIEWFVRELLQFAEDLETVFLCHLPMDELTHQQSQNFEVAALCHICERSFSDRDKKVHDHCHLTGKYRGPAHEVCNINFKDSHTVPIIFHNLSGYDSHFIIKNLASDLEGRIDLLPINKEKYISFTKHLDQNLIRYRFIDSLRFMNSSLNVLSSHLTSFPNLRSQFPDLSNIQFHLLTRKGVYPYDYFDSLEKFSENCLPPISKFYNKLNNVDISQDDYIHAQKIWREFNTQTLGEYSNLYLKTDVLLLADVFEKFRLSCHQTYGLDPAHYFTLPGYTWDAMLKHTCIELELLIDIDMLMFIERGIRGGLSQCSKRYSKANNKYMQNYDPYKSTKFLLYDDVNNQYGWAMSQLLPYNGFKWVDNVDYFDINSIDENSSIGYILEVDLTYPTELHDIHKDLPFCPEHSCPPESKNKKLMCTLYNKTKYIIHYLNLKQALKNGLQLTKIHKILQFNQSLWLKSYIDLNTRLRASAKNEFEKNLFKLMNNAVFGKTMENVRKHSTVKLVTKWLGRYGAEALISKPEFKACSIFSENLVAIELNKTEIYFNKPIYVGMCILELAKTSIYKFHYDYMIPQFDSNCSICYTDTDSLIYEIACPDIYETIKKDCHTHFDTSDYPANNIWNIPHVNKKVPGLMKDENNGCIMTEFVGLRSKMYGIRVEDKDKIKKSKGVKRNIVKTRITFDDYVECLDNNSEKLISQNLIQSQKHDVHSITQIKIALSPHDNKRYIIPNSYETLPWGHYGVPK